MKTYITNKVIFKWYGDEIYKQIASMTEKDEALASVRIHRNVMRSVPVGSYRRAYRKRYVNARGALVSMKPYQQRTPGRLKSSVKRFKSKYKGGGYVIMAGNYYAYYARIVEYGTKMRRQKTTGRFTGAARGAKANVKYLRNAMRDERRRFINEIKQSMSQLRGMNE